MVMLCLVSTHVPIGNLVVGSGAVTVTAAVALLVVSATLVALTWYVPAVEGAVYKPDEAMEPPPASITVQVTAVLLAPVTVAVKVVLPPVNTVVDAGSMDMPAGVTVTAAVAFLVGSATLVAVTW